MEIRLVLPSEIDKIEGLFQAVYNKPQGIEYWMWCFQSPYGYNAMGCFDGDKLVSYYASVLLKEGAITYSSMTHPEYRGNGIYTKVALALYEELAKYSDWCCFYANQNIHDLHIKMGNVEACQIKEYRIPFDKENRLLVLGNPFEWKDPFWTWRFKEHPFEKQRKYFKFYEQDLFNFYEDRVQILNYEDLDRSIRIGMYIASITDKKEICFWSEKELDYPYVLIPQWKMYRALNDDIDIFKVIMNDNIRMWQHDRF